MLVSWMLCGMSGITAEYDLLLVLDNCIITVTEPCITIDICIIR